MRLILLLPISACLLVQEVPADLFISAFNVQIFGRAKMRKPRVVEILVRIINRYDVILIQEIRDSSQTAIKELLKRVNEQAGGDSFEMVLSTRLGPPSWKEQYAYFYRQSKLSVVDTWQYPDNGSDFERPPFSVRFHAAGQNLTDFGFIGIHVKPSNASEEINSLVDVYDELAARWGLKDFIFGGDFNADCNYLRRREWPSIRLRTNSSFQWVITDEMDTTVAPSSCAYDRFVLAGSRLRSSYVSQSAKPFNFSAEWRIDLKATKNVSDHYPIEMRVDTFPIEGTVPSTIQETVSSPTEETVPSSIEETVTSPIDDTVHSGGSRVWFGKARTLPFLVTIVVVKNNLLW